MYPSLFFSFFSLLPTDYQFIKIIGLDICNSTSTSSPRWALMTGTYSTFSEGLYQPKWYLWIHIWKWTWGKLSLGSASKQRLHFEIPFLYTSPISTHPLQGFLMQLAKISLTQWTTISGSSGVLLVLWKVKAMGQLPDWFVPQQERTAVNQAQKEDKAQVYSIYDHTSLRRGGSFWAFLDLNCAVVVEKPSLLLF